MGSTVQYEVSVDTLEVQKLLKSLQNAVSPRSAMTVLEGKVFPWFVEETVARFAVGGDYRSGDWPELSETTQRIREDMGYEGNFPMNIRTEKLFHYVTTGRQTRMSESGAEMVMPGDAPDSQTHREYLTAQMGTDVNPRFPDAVTPARPVMAWAEESDAAQILGMMANHVVEIMRGGATFQ